MLLSCNVQSEGSHGSYRPDAQIVRLMLVTSLHSPTLHGYVESLVIVCSLLVIVHEAIKLSCKSLAGSIRARVAFVSHKGV